MTTVVCELRPFRYIDHKERTAMIFRLYVFFRWVRLTARRDGVAGFSMARKGRHAACGRATRITRYARAHGRMTGYNLRACDLVASLRAERERFALAA